MANETLSKVFNAGCDARLSGVPRECNPYGVGRDRMATYWFMGWSDVDRYWAKLVKRRWRFERLPAVDTGGRVG